MIVKVMFTQRWWLSSKPRASSLPAIYRNRYNNVNNISRFAYMYVPPFELKIDGF